MNINQKETLKKPSHFVGTASNQATKVSSLVSPAMILNKQKDGISNLDTKKQSFGEVKRPSDFILKTDTLTKNIQKKGKNPYEMSHIGNLPNDNLINANSKLQSFATKEELLKLKDTVKYQQQEILISKQHHDKEKSCWQETEKNLKTELERASSKITTMQRKLDETENNKFMDTKSIYEKFISLQAKYDREKDALEDKVSFLEQKLSRYYSENEELLKTLQVEKDITSKLLTNLKDLEMENKVNGAKYEERILQLNTTIEIVKRENTVHESTESELRNRCEKAEESVSEKSKCYQELFQINKSLETLTHEQSDKLELLEDKIRVLEENLSACLSENKNYKLSVEEKVCEIELLNNKLRGLNEDNELVKIDLSNAISENEKLKQLKLESQEYEKTCKALQLTNQQLNIRLEALNEMLKIQEASLNGLPCGTQSETLLQAWRCKVYQLLVLLKSKTF